MASKFKIIDEEVVSLARHFDTLADIVRKSNRFCNHHGNSFSDTSPIEKKNIRWELDSYNSYFNKVQRKCQAKSDGCAQFLHTIKKQTDAGDNQMAKSAADSGKATTA